MLESFIKSPLEPPLARLDGAKAGPVRMVLAAGNDELSSVLAVLLVTDWLGVLTLGETRGDGLLRLRVNNLIHSTSPLSMLMSVL